MNSKERVRAVFEKRIPDRIPMWCGASPEFIEKVKRERNLGSEEEVLEWFHDDFRRLASRYVGPAKYDQSQVEEEGKSVSIFGIERHGVGIGQASLHPLADASLEEIHAYAWPDPAWFDTSHIREDALKYEGKYAIMCGEWTPFFHDAVDLLGMENLMIMMYEEPEKVHAVFGHIVDFYYDITKRTMEAASDLIDIFFFGNDLGSQTGPMVGPELFEEFMAPYMKRMTDLAHSYGIFTMMHCCGSYYQLMPHLIEAGIDAVQALQPATPEMQAENLKKNFGGKMIFNGGVDSVNVLIGGTVEDTENYTRKVIKAMKPGGGYILSASHDYLLEETPIENVEKMFETGLAFGKYE